MHSSNIDTAMQHGRAASIPLYPNKKKKPPKMAAFPELAETEVLLGRLLARGIEGAGVVDLGDLMIAEAEHLAQDLVGVLAEQG